jgi:hypothetical protein
MISFQCVCGRQLKVADDRAGQEGQCPDCSRWLAIPETALMAQGVVASANETATAPPVALRDGMPPSSPAASGTRRRRDLVYLVVGLVAAAAVVLLIVYWPFDTSSGRDSLASETASDLASRKAASEGNLKLLIAGLRQMHDVTGELPPPAICDQKSGKPLLSWRVAVLPFIEQKPLYEAFHLNEPWDSEHNRQLLDKMPKVFEIRSVTKAEPYTTHYQAIVGEGAAWELQPKAGRPLGAAGLKLNSFTDGAANTILLVEAAQPVPWTKPEDVAYNPGSMQSRLGGVFTEGFHVGMADGSVRLVGWSPPEVVLTRLITRAGKEYLPKDWYLPGDHKWSEKPIKLEKKTPGAGG